MKALTFIHAGQVIRNPFFSPCGRHQVNPVVAYGFESVETGGGCAALRLDLSDHHFMLLTDESGSYEPDLDDWENALVGKLEMESGDEVCCVFARELLRLIG